MKKLIKYCLIIILLSSQSILEVYCKEQFPISKEEISSKKVILTQQEYQELSNKAELGYSILQRIRNLEKLYLDMKGILDGVNSIVTLIKKTLNINFEPSTDSNEFTHLSGVVLSPGFVEFQVNTSNGESFNKLDIENLELDVYYNKNLFYIDHIEGKGIFGSDFKIQPLPQSSKSAKDRISIPLSDVLASSANFKIYLGPLDPKTIKVGDSSLVSIKTYKRVPKGEKEPLVYGLVEDSPDTIEVVVI